MVEAYVSSILQAHPKRENRYMNYSQRISKWKMYQNFLIIPWISSPHSSEFKYRKRHRCHGPITSGCYHHRINSMVENHCRSANLCCRDSIACNSRVFPQLHPLSVRRTRWHITACTVCGRQFTITTHCRSVKFMMSCLALKNGDHSPNFELWCLVLSVELVWYIQSSQLQPVLSVNDGDISILLHNQQYQLSEFSFPCTWQLWSVSREAPKVGCMVWERPLC